MTSKNQYHPGAMDSADTPDFYDLVPQARRLLDNPPDYGPDKNRFAERAALAADSGSDFYKRFPGAKRLCGM